MEKPHIELADEERDQLKTLLSRGKLAAKVFKRATALLESGRGQSLSAVAKTLGVSYPTVLSWRNKYQTKKLQCLYDAPRSGRPIEIDGEARAKITALASTPAPEGHARWKLDLLADKAVELKYCEHLSGTHVGTLLKKNELQPHLKRTWCIGKIDAAFLARMEELLAPYAEAYDPLYPVICYDERPCFLIGEAVAALPMTTGQVAKEHYAYVKNGSCALLAAIEPLTGQRLGVVRTQRTKKEFMEFCQALLKAWPGAEKIRLVLDNLNTHNTSAFYEHLPAAEARALAEKFEFHYTPKSASWLNMIEIEFSALVRDCLQRRIPTQELLEKEVLALLKERAEKKIKINWQFSLKAARARMNSHYSRVNAENSQYKET
jgi:transposase